MYNPLNPSRAVDVSVIVPVYNGGRKLRRCVHALKRQDTDKSYEIIVVDDGSDDGSAEALENDGVRIFGQENQGPAVARNLGVEKAQGEIVLFTDADCAPRPDWLEKMVGPLETLSVSGVKGSYLTHQKGIVPRFVQLEYESKYERMQKDRFIDFIDTYAAGFVKKDFLKAGQYDARFPTASVEDQEFSFRMWEKGFRMVFNPEARVYHTHSHSLCNYMKKKFRIGFWKALVLKEHPQKMVRDSHTPQLLKLEMSFALLFLISLMLWPVDGVFFSYALYPLGGFLLAITPSVLRLLKRDPAVGLFSPVLLFARAVSLGSGLVAGGIRFYLLRERPGFREQHATKET